jgi:ribonuclease HII
LRPLPGYGWSQNKGYPTPDHRRAIARLGVHPLHRRSFAGVREHLPDLLSEAAE